MGKRNIVKLMLILSTIVTICLVMCICVKTISISTSKMYDISIISMDADDVDINMVTGYGTKIAGVRDAYIVEADDNVYFVRENNISVISDIDNIDSSAYIGKSIISMLDSVINGQLVVMKSDITEQVNGVECYVFNIDIEDNIYGIYDVKCYLKKSGELYRVEAKTRDDLMITVTRSEAESCSKESIKRFQDGSVYYAYAKNDIYNNSVSDNVYTYGKYTLVDSVIDSYNKWLGGKL